ncbi:chromosome partitioning protein ParB [Luteitalea sp. TBR-22]|uniref:thermonuclease family protein n=1 Tax=Luteitalea sp. TBR-22 TaxID=2802971 RepID=UPI001AF66F77|nr:thermonuclease family protein [Luteitalea sp. TBR-22]BCS35445.1 chromosome partitioning protein ParB [Luteitalea sp. TBR-22]
MKTALRCLVVAALVCPSPSMAQVPGETFDALVAKVVDGDTIDVRRAGGHATIRIRLDGIDTPERGEPFSSAATRFTRAESFGRTVRVRGTDVDRYGRLVARVTREGADLSVSLVRAGLACVYRKYSRDPLLLRAEAEARSAARGLWGTTPQPRCVEQAR